MVLHRFEGSIICFKHFCATIFVQPQNQCLQTPGEIPAGPQAEKKSREGNGHVNMEQRGVWNEKREKNPETDEVRSYAKLFWNGG